MRVSVSPEGSILYIDGRFTFVRHKEFSECLSKAKAPVTVDLSQAEYVDSAALGMLLIARDKLGPITLRGAHGSVKDTLAIASFHKVFTIV